MSHITQALIDEAVAHCLTGRRPPFTAHEIQQLLNAWQERDTLRAQLSAAEARAERLAVLLARYRNETPVGNQPHMLAHLADAALAEGEAG